MQTGSQLQYFGRLRRAAEASLVLAATVLTSISSAVAQANVPIVRDAEIEALVRDYARPIFKAAGLNSGVDIVLINDSSFNAFVAGRRMFINTGALLAADTPNEIIGVIAHEAGHLAGAIRSGCGNNWRALKRWRLSALYSASARSPRRLRPTLRR
jgi:predicted Zn-dependent protease